MCIGYALMTSQLKMFDLNVGKQKGFRMTVSVPMSHMYSVCVCVFA